MVLEGPRTKAETEKMIAQVAAEGEKKAREIEATTERPAPRSTPRPPSSRPRSPRPSARPTPRPTELSNQAEAERYRQYVQTLGGPDAYNRYVFAEGLSSDLHLGVFYAGPGTFWTDLKGFEQVMLGKLADDTSKRPAVPVARRAAPDR